MGARRWSRGEVSRNDSSVKEAKNERGLTIMRKWHKGYWYWLSIFLFASVWGGFGIAAHAQGVGAFGLPGAGEGSSSENSRYPFKLILEGVLNPTLDNQRNLAVLTMTVRGFREYYQFAVRRAALPELPQASPQEVLNSLDKYKVQMKILGNKQLMDKIGQSLPGTPVKVTGFFSRKYRELTVVDVELFGQDGLFDSSDAGKIYQK